MPWTEYVGRVVEVNNDSVTLECVSVFSISLTMDSIELWKTLLKKGGRVGILALDDGSIRVRQIHDQKLSSTNSASPDVRRKQRL